MNKKIFMTVIFTSIGSMLGSYIYKTLSHENISFDKTLVETSSKINPTLPMVLDKETRWDSTLPGPGNKFTYIYSLINYTAEQIDTAALRVAITPSIVNNYNTSTGMQEFRSNKVELHYLYRDKVGKYLMEIVVTPDQK